MIGIYLFQRYLNKKSDFDFENYWENKFIPRQRNYWFIVLIYFLIGFSIISEILLYNISGFVVSFLIIVFVFFVYGGNFLRMILRFIGTNNARYIQIKSGMQFQESTFSKDNVVG